MASLNNLLKNTQLGEADCTIQDFIEDVVCVMVDECFHEDSLVCSPVIPSRIVIWDKVINYSEQTRQFKEDEVVKLHINLTNSLSEKMYELIFDDGSVIKVTGNS